MYYHKPKIEKDFLQACEAGDQRAMENILQEMDSLSEAEADYATSDDMQTIFCNCSIMFDNFINATLAKKPCEQINMTNKINTDMAMTGSTKQIAMEYPIITETVHGKDIQHGDSVLLRGEFRTVGRKEINNDSFMGYNIQGQNGSLKRGEFIRQLFPRFYQGEFKGYVSNR